MEARDVAKLRSEATSSSELWINDNIIDLFLERVRRHIGGEESSVEIFETKFWGSSRATVDLNVWWQSR